MVATLLDGSDGAYERATRGSMCLPGDTRQRVRRSLAPLA